MESRAQSMQVRLSSALPEPGTGSLAGEQGAQTASRHRRHLCGRRSRVNSVSQTPHHRSSEDDTDSADELESWRERSAVVIVIVDGNDDSDSLRPRGAREEEEEEERRLLLRSGEPASEAAARSDDLYLCRCCWFIFLCRQEVAGVDTTERREELLDDVTEATSESSSPAAREESREEGRSSYDAKAEREREEDEERLPLLPPLLRRLERDCCFSHWRRSGSLSEMESGMDTLACAFVQRMEKGMVGEEGCCLLLPTYRYTTDISTKMNDDEW